MSLHGTTWADWAVDFAADAAVDHVTSSIAKNVAKRLGLLSRSDEYPEGLMELLFSEISTECQNDSFPARVGVQHLTLEDQIKVCLTIWVILEKRMYLAFLEALPPKGQFLKPAYSIMWDCIFGSPGQSTPLEILTRLHAWLRQNRPTTYQIKQARDYQRRVLKKPDSWARDVVAASIAEHHAMLAKLARPSG